VRGATVRPRPAAVGLALLCASCYTTRGVAPSGTVGLGAGAAHPGELVLAAERRRRVRIGPRSWLRFIRHDGMVTPWFEARQLRVSGEGVLAPGGTSPGSPALYVRWDEVARMEVNDLDVGLTVVGALGAATAVMGAAMVEMMLMAAIAGLTGGHIRPSELGITRSAFDAVVEQAGKRPPDAPTAALLALAPAPPLPPVEAAAVRPLFSSAAIRRDLVRLVLATELGATSWPLYPSGSFVAVARIHNGFEVGGGLRLLSTPAGPDSSAARVTPLALLRLGWHLDLDARRRVALPLLFEGALGSQGHVRLVWGVRVRVTERATLGLYPWNPMLWPQPHPANADVSNAIAAPVQGAQPGYLSSLDVAWAI
jgi:hypothetical protein